MNSVLDRETDAISGLVGLKQQAQVNEEESSSGFKVKEKARSYSLISEKNSRLAILVHGFTGSPNDMRELADFLFASGIDVVVVRLAGHGTNIKDLINTSYNDWYRSLEEAVYMVEGLSQKKKIYLVGYSFGSNLILDAAARDPEKYSGVICLGTSVFWRYRFYYFIIYNIFRLLGIEKVRKPYVPKDKIVLFEAAGNYAAFPTKGLGEFRDIVRAMSSEKLNKVTSPLIIIHSRGDRISHPKSSEYIFENAGSEKKEMFMLSAFNHNPLSSENKNKIFEKVLQFIHT